MTVIHSQKDDTVDQICQRAYGATAGITEIVMEQNPGLSKYGELLPAGIAITLPNIPVQQQSETVSLWD